MKITELRIGVWVNDLNGNPFQIEDAEDLADFEQYENAYPIALTQEWLKKFGFGDLKKGWGYTKEIDTPAAMVYLHWAYNESTIYLEDRSGEVDIILPCQYVHQLQNLYFALTGTELEIKNPHE